MRDVQTNAMNELHFARRIRHHLDQSTQLDRTTTDKLRAARALALSRQRPEPTPVLAWADNVFGNEQIRGAQVRTPVT